jgi:hypothetical protein
MNPDGFWLTRNVNTTHTSQKDIQEYVSWDAVFPICIGLLTYYNCNFQQFLIQHLHGSADVNVLLRC